jgi:hypothetical protein
VASPVVRNRVAPVAGLSGTSPSDTAIGDLVLVFTFERAGAGVPTHTVQGGFVQVISQDHNDGSTDGRLSVARKVATQAGAQSYQGFTSSTGSPVAWTALVVVQVGTHAPGTVVGTGVSATGTGVPNPPALTLGATRDWLVLACSAWHHSAVATITPTAPTNYTNLIEVAGTSNGDIAVAQRSLTAAASEDPGTFGDNITPNGTCSVTVGVGNPLNQTLTADRGDVGLVGNASGLLATRLFVAAAGAVALAGPATALRAGRVIGAVTGGAAVAGFDAVFTIESSDPVLVADTGAVPVGASTAALRAARRLDGAPGAFGVDGQVAAPRVSRVLGGALGAVALDGDPADLRRGRFFAVDPGAFASAADPAAVTITRRLTAEVWSVSLAGPAAALFVGAPPSTQTAPWTERVSHKQSSARRVLVGGGVWTVDRLAARLRVKTWVARRILARMVATGVARRTRKGYTCCG